MMRSTGRASFAVLTRTLRRVLAFGVIGFALVGCGAATDPSVPRGSPSPLPSAGSTKGAAPTTSSEATAPVADGLRYVWIGPSKEVSALGGPLALSIIRFRDSNFDFIFGAQGEEALNSTVSEPAPGQVRLTSVNTTGGCKVGDEGIYRWMTTPDGAGLTLTKVAEACSPRAEAASGQWIRAACKDFGCLGDLDPGRHVTSFFEPLGQPATSTGPWRMQYGQLSYTVPSGWANADDAIGFYNLVPQDAYAKPASNETAYRGISLLADAAIAAQDAACSPKIEPGIGRTPGEMAARIALIPGLAVGAATSIMIAGRPGTMLDVALKSGWNRFCPVGGGVPVIVEADTSDPLAWRMTAAGRWHLFLVDVAEGRTMAILIDSFDQPSLFDDLVVQAMPIVTSFELHPPTP